MLTSIEWARSIELALYPSTALHGMPIIELCHQEYSGSNDVASWGYACWTKVLHIGKVTGLEDLVVRVYEVTDSWGCTSTTPVEQIGFEEDHIRTYFVRVNR